MGVGDDWMPLESKVASRLAKFCEVRICKRPREGVMGRGMATWWLGIVGGMLCF